MSFFSRTETVVTTKTLPYPSSAVLAIVQSPHDIVHLNPLVVSAAPRDSDPSIWEIVDTLPMLWGWVSMKSAYTATLESTEDGVVVRTKAGAGVSTRSVWRCVEREEGARRVCVVEESAEVRAPVWVMAYVLGQVRASHAMLLERLEEKLRGNSTNEG